MARGQRGSVGPDSCREPGFGSWHGGIRHHSPPSRSSCSILLPTGCRSPAHAGTCWWHRCGKQGLGTAAAELPATPALPRASRNSPSRWCQAPAGPAARTVPARLHPRGCRDYGLGQGLGLGPAHPSHRDRAGVRWAVALQHPGCPVPPGTRCGADSGSLHLKKPVPPCYLHTLRSASPPAAAVQYFYLSARFPVCNPHVYGRRAAGGHRRGGTSAAHSLSHWVPAAPRGAEVLETPGIAPKRTFPAPLRS